MVSGVTFAPGKTRMRTTVASVSAGNEQDAVFARNQRASRAADLADHRAALHSVGPDGGAVDRRCGGLEAGNDEDSDPNNDDGDASVNEHLAFLFLLKIWPGDIHVGMGGSTCRAKGNGGIQSENKEVIEDGGERQRKDC